MLYNYKSPKSQSSSYSQTGTLWVTVDPAKTQRLIYNMMFPILSLR